MQSKLKIPVVIFIFVLLISYIVALVLEDIDNRKALAFAQTIENPVTFNYQKDYQQVNSVVDQYAVPGYVWSTGKIILNRGIPQYSKERVIKFIVFDESKQPSILYAKHVEDSTAYKSKTPFNTPFPSIDREKLSSSYLNDYLKRGAEIKVVLVTGAPLSLPEEMKVKQAMLFAAKKARSSPQQSWLVNGRQLLIDGKTTFPISTMFTYGGNYE